MAAELEGDREESRAEEQEEDLWSAILNDVATSSARTQPQVPKTLLVLGDVSSGKSTLVDRLCQISKSHPIGGRFPLSGCSLEYRFIDVQDEETDDLVDRMSVWILDGVVWHSSLLPFVLTKSNIAHTTVMIVVDMSQPWSIMESLERWAEVVRRHIQSLGIPARELREMEDAMVKQFQSYVDPEQDTIHTPSSDEESVALPLGANTLTCNLGVPIIVVCCKSDAVTQLEKTNGYKEEHFDFIQQAIRKFSLQYGAALFYVSTKEDKNVKLLHNYLVHRAYGMPFKEVAWVVDKDSIFIPSGWDNEKKISILYEHMKWIRPDEPFENIIMAPKKSQPESEVYQLKAADDQVFLLAQQAHMVKAPKAAVSPASVGAMSKERSPVSRPSPTAAKVPGEMGDAKPPGETVLANFFNSLLSKKQTGVKSSSSMRATTRNEAAAELDRMQTKKPGTKS